MRSTNRTSKLGRVLAGLAGVCLLLMMMSWMGQFKHADMLHQRGSEEFAQEQRVRRSHVSYAPSSSSSSSSAVVPSSPPSAKSFGRVVPPDDPYGFAAQCGHIANEVAKNSSWMPAHVSQTRMGYRFSHHGVADHVSQYAMELGCYDCALVETYSEVKARYRDRQVAFFDIGSNMGSEFAQAAMNGDLVMAFEPLQPNLHRICENVWLNGWRHNVRIFPVGLADQDMPDKPMCFNLGNTGSSEVGSGCGAESTFPVKVVSLQRLFKEERIDEIPGPWFVHVDVENFEYKVLHAGRDFFADKRIVVLAVSLGRNIRAHPWGSYNELIAWFLDQGYYVMAWGVKYATKESISSIPETVSDIFLMRNL